MNVAQWQGGPVTPPGPSSLFVAFLQLAGLQWNCSNPPPQGTTWPSEHSHSTVQSVWMLRIKYSGLWRRVTWYFGETYCRHLQGWRTIRAERNILDVGKKGTLAHLTFPLEEGNGFVNASLLTTERHIARRSILNVWIYLAFLFLTIHIDSLNIQPRVHKQV